MVVIRKLALKIIKILYFLMVFYVTARIVPRPEIYLDYNLAEKLSDFFYGSVSADSMYDTYFNVVIATITPLTMVIYLLTMKLIKITRKK